MSYPLTRIDDIIDELGNSRNFSMLDLVQGLINEKDRGKIAFSLPYQHLQFKSLSFGILLSFNSC